MNVFDVIVIGAGHAGVEASVLPARMGVSVLMINLSADTIGQMSCNPAIGGVGKGQLVREVDILGGEMGRAADINGIQFRQLNASKGPAVRSSRAQIDRVQYASYMKKVVLEQKNLTFYCGEVQEILVSHGEVQGVKVCDGAVFKAKNVIVTAGTFLNGRIHIGKKIIAGGRIDEKASVLLAQNLKDLGFVLRNFKTGTPPRLDARTIDFSLMKRQDSDIPPIPFSYHTKQIPLEQKLIPCWITHTTKQTHEIIENNFHLSPMYSGQIDATGVRYCPSIEDKLKKFGSRESHHVFIEPDGLNTDIVYPNGISTGLPEDVQESFVRTIPGLEKVKFLKYGYSIEHAVIFAEELKATLESKRIKGLFFAGQINGTTGYEEAAAQGAVAGINAALNVQQRPALVLKRDESYTGVLIDDLITKGTNEPYRMFTSRVEYRLIVREDNTDLRLMKYAYDLGLMSHEYAKHIEEKYQHINETVEYLSKKRVDADILNPLLISVDSSIVVGSGNLKDILKRPQVTIDMLADIDSIIQERTQQERIHIEYQIKYEGFIERQLKEVEKFKYLENIIIPEGLDLSKIQELSFEVRQKFLHFKPANLGQANRISGVTPAAISVLMMAIKRFFLKSS